MAQTAFTEISGQFPGYINFNKAEDGSMTVTVRSAPSTRNGGFVCGFAPRDTGQPGRCTPGDANCNNYCNHDHSKPMADHPLPVEHIYCGQSASLTISAADWSDLIAKLGE